LCGDAPNSIVTQNVIRNSKGYGIQAAGGGFACSVYSNNAIISYYNGIDINGDVQNGIVANNMIENVYANSLTLENSIGPCNGWTVENNIFDSRSETGGGWRYSVYLNGITSVTFAANDYLSPADQPNMIAVVNGQAMSSSQWQALANDSATSLYNQDPLFTNIATGDFALLPGSPVISAGVVIPNVTIGNPVNIGAN